MARALMVVPPFMKYSAGPLLGPALLQAKAIQRGHKCCLLDLNAHYIRHHSPERAVNRGVFVGDHDKPRGPSSQTLADIERSFLEEILNGFCNLGCDHEKADALRRLRFGFLRHDEVKNAGDSLAASSFGAWTRNLFDSKVKDPPELFGVSLLHAGQVVPAVAASMIAKTLWPRTLVVWGGPHISGIGKAIADDMDERRFAADLFVTGHAEQTFASLLDHLSLTNARVRPSGVEDGVRGEAIAPTFNNLELYDNPTVLPAQSTLGCAYGRCTFCTYPMIEPTPAKLDLCLTVDSVAKAAQELGASVAIKDSLVTAHRLREIGATIGGRVSWSACTKLNSKLDQALLKSLNCNGLKTLEVGLESLLVDTQRRVAKVHPPHLFEEFLENVAQISDLSLVVNYMTHFPWEDEEVSQSKRMDAEGLIGLYLGDRGKLEHNPFELERLSPMAKDPERFFIDSRSLKLWPWASVVEYEKLPGAEV